jgi:hypothetical protein
MTGRARAHRYGDYEPRGRLLPHRENGRFHCRSGRQAIVDENDRAIAKDRQWMLAAKQPIASFELQPLARSDVLDLRGRQTEIGNQVMAEHLDASGGDRAHRQLRVARHAKLAHEKEVERSPQQKGDLEGNRHAPARQRQHDEVGIMRVVIQSRRKLTTGIQAILEWPH